MSHVDLGFAQKCEPWRVASYQFPSKIGGRPAWLDLGNLPTPEDLQCDTCHKPLTYLCQVYAPYEEDDANFHRTVFVFICRDPDCCVRNSSCNIKAFRCCLPRHNQFYSSEPPPEKEDPDFGIPLNLCKVCGCLGPKRCGRCQRVRYCSKEHQVIDWREGHKKECGNGDVGRVWSGLYPEFEMVMEEEEEYVEKVVDESEEIDKFDQLVREGKTGTMSDAADSEMEKFAACDNDKAFTRFKERIGDNTDQVLRYERGGEPLWIANEPKPEVIPDCEYCKGPRQYEFQIMPQLLSILHENELDIGIVIVYTCRKSCTQGEHYKREFIYKQDVITSV